MSNRKSKTPQPPRQLPPWQLALICVGLISVSLLVFALFDHVIPHSESQAVYTPPTGNAVFDVAPVEAAQTPSGAEAADAGIVSEEAAPVEASQAQAAPETDADPPQPEVSMDPAEREALIAQQAAAGDFSLKFADKFTSGEVIQTDTTYQSANVNITLTRMKGQVGEYEQVGYIADIYIRNIDCLRTVLAKDTFGRSITEKAESMSKRANAICAINSDFYSFGSAGIVIRNGVLYRKKYEPDEEVLVIYRNGDMKVFRKGSEIDVDQLMADGAWQAFSFGPGLLTESGELRKSYKRTIHDPRTLIGMIEPGHYLFIVVDGRQNGYSEGLNYYECGLLAQKLGCSVAYNLDGGKTSRMLFMHKTVNRPYNGGRDTSDLICIADITE